MRLQRPRHGVHRSRHAHGHGRPAGPAARRPARGAARLSGGQPRGIPDMAGYAVGLRLVDRALAETGLSAAEATLLPAARLLGRSQPGETNPDS
ncbi:DUF2268 domain-containing putative Zn-dependent protease [Nonomuraea sp. NPDC052265]|uniref:DUF2268 domain-containing putative Zn-dependent protease n=1 Tax=Nonomuraea sp. NPDC052265 TaxID=3364374 RepID=UPI0037CC84B8